MKALTIIGILIMHLLVGGAPVAAQQCTQELESGLLPSSLAFDSGVALLARFFSPFGVEGRVEVYGRSAASGVFELQQTLRPEIPRPSEQWFGTDVDTDGVTIVVSSEGMNFPGERSAVYIFEKNAGLQSWVQVAKVIPPASSSSHQFSGHVVASGDQILIGAPAEGPGVVYVLNRDAATGQWVYGQTITLPAGITGVGFGSSLDLDGDLLAIGDPWVNSNRGAVHTFERFSVTGAWTYAGSLIAGVLAGSRFGETVAVQGERILVGAPGWGFDEGLTKLYERDPVTNHWLVGFEWANAFAHANSSCGESVALDGDNAYFSIPRGSGAGGTGGSIKHMRYDSSSSSWIYQGSIGPPAPQAGFAYTDVSSSGIGAIDGELVYAADYLQNWNLFGSRLFFAGDSDQDCDGNGLADLCEISGGTGIDLNGNGLLDICEGIGSAYCQPTALNSAGILGQLSADGSQFVLENNITLRTTELPPNQFGYALNSPYQGVIPNVGGSQGSLCIFGASLGRHNRPGEVRYSGAAGEFDLIVDLTSFPSPMGAIMVQAGETWNFQVWHRDQNPSNTSNLTNAVSLTFQ